MDEAMADLAPGFDNPPIDAARAFRAILESMARPGRINVLETGLDTPAPLLQTTAAVLLTLVDYDTPLWLSPDLRRPEVEAYLRFHCGAPIVEAPGDAAFAVIAADELSPLGRFNAGTPEYPDRSATLILQVDALDSGGGLTLTGPGIDGEHHFAAPPLDGAFWRAVQANNERYPLGLDFILAAPEAVAAIPRSTRVILAGAC